jgi:hypothetical protein
VKCKDKPCEDGLHAEYPDYSRVLYCWTDECCGDEYHCRKCGWFISECGCGFMNGASKISNKRWETIQRKKRERWAKQREVVDANQDSVHAPQE